MEKGDYRYMCSREPLTYSTPVYRAYSVSRRLALKQMPA